MYFDDIVNDFITIKEKGFIKSHRSGDTGIGKTLEELLFIKENNNNTPDYNGIEIKSHRMSSSSRITLFTKSPSYPNSINNVLREKYGIQKDENLKKLHVSIYSNKWTSYPSGYSFRSVINKNKINLLVKDTNTNELLDYNIYWLFSDLKNILETKLKYMAFVEADTMLHNNEEYFHYKKLVIYHDIDFAKFLYHIHKGNIIFDLRLGVYKNINSKNYGKTHDHGSGFRIIKHNLEKLYNNTIVI